MRSYSLGVESTCKEVLLEVITLHLQKRQSATVLLHSATIGYIAPVALVDFPLLCSATVAKKIATIALL